MVSNNSINAQNAQYNLIVGTGSAYTNIAPNATAGVPLVSNGSSANPSFETMLTEELLNHIESKATDWNNHPYYRFYFVFRHHRYALHIAEQTKRIKISNGSVMITEKLCPAVS